MFTRTRLIMLTGFCLTMFSWPLPALFAAEGATAMPALDTQGIIRVSKATQAEPDKDKQAENKPDTETGDEASEEDAAPAVIVPDNVWYGLDQTSASGLIRSMPDRFAAPVYFHIFKDLLVTDAAPFGTPRDEVTAEAEEDTAPSSKKRPSRMRDRKNRQAQNSSVFDGDLPQPAALSATIEAAPYDFLLLRLETLYRIGAFEDAERLYKTLFPQLPEDERLAVHGLNILLAKGRLAAACLDVQTMESRFNQAAFWLDFNRFCARHYETDDDMAAQTVTAIAENIASDDDSSTGTDTDTGTGTSQDNAEANGASKADSAIGMAPVVDDKDGDDAGAAGDPAGESATAPVRKRSGIPAENFVMFPYFSAVLDGQVTPQMLVTMSLTERLMAHAAKAVPFKAVLAHYKNDVTSVPSEILKILILQDEKANAHHACVAQEGFARGIINSRSLTLLMRSLEFAEASFKDGSMARHSLHPCWKPAWYMQWIEKADDGAQKTIRVRQTFDYISKNYPALIDGFEQYFVDLDPVSLGAASWTAAASIIRTQGSLPENWVARWKSVHPQTAKTSGDAKNETESNGAPEQNNPQNHDADAAAQAEQNGIDGENVNGRGVSTPVTNGDPALDNAPETANTANNAANSGGSNHTDGLAPYWYFLSLQDPSSFTAESYIAWVRQWSPKLPLVAQKDPARTLSLLKNVLELEKYEEAAKLCYEKFFSLTFYRNYVISSYSLTGRAFAANQSSRFGEAVLLYLHVLASQSPSNTYPEYLSGMVDILYKAGYQEHAKNIIVSTLSVGKD